MIWDISSNRITGHKAVEERRLWRLREPLCVKCKARGIVKQVDEIDHIIPLSQGGKDDETNRQSLCFDCHRIKTMDEQSGVYKPQYLPNWLKPASIKLTIVYGARCSGKNTYVRKHNVDGNAIIVDIDEIRSRVTELTLWEDVSLNGYTRALRYRNSVLGRIGEGSTDGRDNAYLVLRCDQDELDWWIDKMQPAHVELMTTGLTECLKRCLADRNRPKTHPNDIRQWFLAKNRKWKSTIANGFDDDGNPINEINTSPIRGI